MSAGESPFFEPEASDSVPVIFDAWRPVHFDSTFTHNVSISGFEDTGFTECDHFRNLLGQYGPVSKERISSHGRKAVLVSLVNGFAARVAVTFLQNWRFDGKPLNVELAVFHDTTVQNGADVICDYQEEDDLEVEDYSAMWFPSEFVSVKPPAVNISHLAPADAIVTRGARGVLQFPSVESAARFIAARNFTKVGRTVVTLRFARPIGPDE
jgi:hypothetical protein